MAMIKGKISHMRPSDTGAGCINEWAQARRDSNFMCKKRNKNYFLDKKMVAQIDVHYRILTYRIPAVPERDTPLTLFHHSSRIHEQQYTDASLHEF